MNSLHLTTAQLLLIHEWCDIAEQLGKDQARVAEKDRLWERCAQLLHRVAESQLLRKLISTELVVRGTTPLTGAPKAAI